jgi:D-alanyl-lipoteichoic acid acyltransferase DltB (MBOAT superfamily)
LVYYFKTNKSGHPLGFFFYNFDKIDYLKVEIEKDIKNRRTLREATKKLVEGGAE